MRYIIDLQHRLNNKLQSYVRSVADRQFTNKVLLGETEICAPTDDFNAVYQILHMFNHFFSTRNSFKQFIDYYYLLKKRLPADVRSQCLEVFKELKLDKYASGIMWIMKDVLGLDETCLIGDADEHQGQLFKK